MRRGRSVEEIEEEDEREEEIDIYLHKTYINVVPTPDDTVA